MGEGWSDFVALTLTTSAADTPVLARGIGTYVSFQPNDGNGIRPTPYSTDMSVDPATYAAVADTVNISQPHGIGYVWNSMLWEVSASGRPSPGGARPARAGLAPRSAPRPGARTPPPPPRT